MTNGQIPWDAQSGEQPAAGMGQQQAPQDIQPAAPQQYGQPADQSFPQPPLPADPQYRQPVQQPGYAQPAEQSGYAAPAPQPGYAQPTQPVPAQGDRIRVPAARLCTAAVLRPTDPTRSRCGSGPRLWRIRDSFRQ